MSAARSTARAALQQVSGGEDEVGAIEVVVFRIEMWRGRWRRGVIVPFHFRIVSDSISVEIGFGVNVASAVKIEP